MDSTAPHARCAKMVTSGVLAEQCCAALSLSRYQCPRKPKTTTQQTYVPTPWCLALFFWIVLVDYEDPSCCSASTFKADCTSKLNDEDKFKQLVGRAVMHETSTCLRLPTIVSLHCTPMIHNHSAAPSLAPTHNLSGKLSHEAYP